MWIFTEPSKGGHQGLHYNSQADEEQGSREAEAFPGEQHVPGKHVVLINPTLYSIQDRQFNVKLERNQDWGTLNQSYVFQEDNGLPIHIKGGSTDMLLYRVTMTLTIIGRIKNPFKSLNLVPGS